MILFTHILPLVLVSANEPRMCVSHSVNEL